jgi:hypothetical protein
LISTKIAGYSQATDNRSTFILFRHPEQIYLVQCRAGYDTTRMPPTYSICLLYTQTSP